MNKTFLAESRLVMDVLPFIAQEKIFALKGDTAINFFIRDLPRLSADIDLAYCPIESKNATLENANAAFERIVANLKSSLGVDVIVHKDEEGEFISKIEVQSEQTRIKIIPDFVFRGTIYPVKEMKTPVRVSQVLERSASIQVLSFEELYAAKLLAILENQAPWDLFDMKLLWGQEGLSDEMIKALVVYLAAHARAPQELLNPVLQPFPADFSSSLSGLTSVVTDNEQLIKLRDLICKNIVTMLVDEEKHFLLSFFELEPKWELMELPIDIKELPGIKNKMLHLRKMALEQRKQTVEELEIVLSSG